MEEKNIIWPQGKRFAFSVFDDTDLETIGNASTIYSFLKDNGILTTKSVWPIKGQQKPTIDGDTCENSEYREWVKKLQTDGFEIAFHNATFHTSTRMETLQGLQKFHEYFGHWPMSMANHADCQENIYWGQNRLSGLSKILYNLLTRGKRINFYRGHTEKDPLFWGDYCKKYITYVRNFVFEDINTLKQCPFMPYHDTARPYVNFWFASCEGANVQSFNNAIAEANQDRLEAEGGACIMYTHFANGFYLDGGLDKKFEFLIKRLATKNGWFVPVSTLLDYLRKNNGDYIITRAQRAMLERKWLWHKLRVGTT
jgi:hypothetical protein